MPGARRTIYCLSSNNVGRNAVRARPFWAPPGADLSVEPRRRVEQPRGTAGSRGDAGCYGEYPRADSNRPRKGLAPHRQQQLRASRVSGYLTAPPASAGPPSPTPTGRRRCSPYPTESLWYGGEPLAGSGNPRHVLRVVPQQPEPRPTRRLPDALCRSPHGQARARQIAVSLRGTVAAVKATTPSDSPTARRPRAHPGKPNRSPSRAQARCGCAGLASHCRVPRCGLSWRAA